jgi:hypothetical protein
MQGGNMLKNLNNNVSLDDYVGCFGNFNRKNIICKKYCALNLRCAIENEQNVRMELLEDLVASEGLFLKGN